MLDDLMAVAWAPRGDALFDRRRAEEIVYRVRVIALAFAALTLAWIAVDAWAFSTRRWHQLALVRVAAGAALLLISWSARRTEPTTRRALLHLLVLFVIPALFYASAIEIFIEVPRRPGAAAIAAGYSFVPFLLAAGIATFPLALVESAALAVVAALAQAWAFRRGIHSLPFEVTQAFWLLDLVAAVAAVAAASQLRMLRQLVEQAVRDRLTGSLRRHAGQALLEQHFRLAQRHGTPLTLLFADIDRFKAVNDRFGHETGDEVLAGVARAFRSCVRQSDVLVRWGGEEFLVMLPSSDGPAATALLERLRAAGFGRTPDGSAVSVSIGIASLPQDAAATAAELVSLADRRMYAAKQAGRDAYVDCAGRARWILHERPMMGAPPPA
jgi:diguanylate cyclase (GGDEF)-like protein